MRTTVRLFAGALLLAGCSRAPASPAATPAVSDSAAFEQWIDGYLGASRGGGGGAADPNRAFLEGLSSDAPSRASARAAEQLAALRRIDTTRLASAQRVDWLLAESSLKRVIQDAQLRTPQRVPGRYLTLGDLFWRVAGDRPPTARDWADVRQMLERAPLAMDLGRRQLVAPPPLWSRLAIATARSYAAFLRGEYPARAGAAPDSVRDTLLALGVRAAAALDAYAAFLQDTLRQGPENSWAAGRPYYDWVLREVNFLPMDAAGMIAAGREIHAATKLALDSLARQLRPGATWRQLVSEMQARHPEPGRITDAYRRHSDRALALLRREGLITIPPRESLTFVPTPPQLRETYAWGGYGGIQLRDSVMVGRFFVTDVVPSMTPAQVAEKLRTQNDGWIPVIALHEGYPGHHLQSVYARLNPRRLRRGGGNTYYGEGWALYAEHWMARAGLFDTPDSRLGQLQMRLWRTARVIIDPSLHTGAMTYEDAVRFFMDEVGLERSAAEAEVNRFTTWPTQAPSYIIGWLEIERLERDLRAALGERFNHRQFVERVLEAGPLPPLLLRRVVLESYGLPS
jgi:uncharacterized protein (DUF885 family)